MGNFLGMLVLCFAAFIFGIWWLGQPEGKALFAAAAIADVAAIWLATTGQLGGAQVIGSVGAGLTSACGAYFVF